MQRENPIRDLQHIPAALQPILNALCEVGIDLSRVIQRGPLGGALGAAVGENLGGDTQKALDLMADDAFCERLKSANVRFYASEEQDVVAELDPAGAYAVAIDPLDGSSNIDVNVSIGTIFSIFEAAATGDASVLRPASEQIGAGYIIYGPQTMLVCTFGKGTQEYLLDPDSKQFVLVAEAVMVPDTSREFAINASNYRHWSRPIRAYIDDCLAGEEGPRASNFNMRWVASLVAETHRILTRGGVFLYPGDARKGYERGRLRMVYECAPIAFVIQQAGGLATDAQDPILGKTAESLHARTPFVFGSTDKVSRIAAYHDLPDEEVNALFGNRGLFRV
ncbi:class 1 fructose-bisphosphatase [Rhodovulum sp. BSW8]|uniref:Fructose-1,6-bisphosphatase class 1 n=1 Tax=Rhodovulum visakhapatnamense TaxID=364297 RepID=A0A4R8G9B4_9RHOB|nr:MULTISPECIES: class 1 fructose-bisphosphatase [Rhodovulum]OLS45556.1 fructose-bisphosphatase [Rhodovulum sulfidophilum]MBL3571063.1 class 1 fructose-bisphosphatase [Rhodovulum visakhapatnamense]MBL3578899.1 class 1 fructose-bisphosphatase [Rhodovulum visakhapatnamense]RBO54946.1 class 1 fructose-bisphosphatase [Rhodovulum sp. BSW8]TDX33759.1 D-fructose 1,6-bisphosphatase [Rhodovulum visakhapatnamense]